MLAFFMLSLLLPDAIAQAPRVPSREIPPSVLVELQQLENRFDLALATDCAAERCFSKGCSYLDHAVADQPRSGSMPGLGEEAGPGSVPTQAYLTQARCAFAHEQGLGASDAQTLVRRLQAKLSSGWTVVTVANEPLQPLPAYLREAPEDEEEAEAEEGAPPEPEPVEAEPAEPEPWSLAVAGRELWSTLLPHFFWMVGLVLAAVVGTVLIWAWRRVGVVSVEEQALLAQLAGEDDTDPTEQDATSIEHGDEAERAFVEEQQAAWRERLEAQDPERPDPEIQALVQRLLRSGDTPLLAKAVLRFPDRLPAVFPRGGDVAAAKLELAAYLETADEAALPSDADFFESLNKHAAAAALLAQADARVVRSLHEDFGAAGIVDLMRRLSPRAGGLLFALAPLEEQHEAARLLTPSELTQTAAWLLRSNRMDPDETAHLFATLEAVQADGARAAVVESAEVSDRGITFDAGGALCVLLARLEPAQRAELLAQALRHFGGAAPRWYQGILVADMLLLLPSEIRADLLLEVDLQPLAAWLSLLSGDQRAQLLSGVPDSLRAALGSVPPSSSLASQLAVAVRGRRELARGYQRHLARLRVPLERALVSAGVESA